MLARGRAVLHGLCCPSGSPNPTAMRDSRASRGDLREEVLQSARPRLLHLGRRFRPARRGGPIASVVELAIIQHSACSLSLSHTHSLSLRRPFSMRQEALFAAGSPRSAGARPVMRWDKLNMYIPSQGTSTTSAVRSALFAFVWDSPRQRTAAPLPLRRHLPY